MATLIQIVGVAVVGEGFGGEMPGVLEPLLGFEPIATVGDVTGDGTATPRTHGGCGLEERLAGRAAVQRVRPTNDAADGKSGDCRSEHDERTERRMTRPDRGDSGDETELLPPNRSVTVAAHAKTSTKTIGFDGTVRIQPQRFMWRSRVRR